MNNSEKIDWALEEYNQICQRDRTDGSIFWNKVTVLIGVNFGLLGVLSLKEITSESITLALPLVMAINFSGLLFSGFWWIVLYRQARWVESWKNLLRKMEDDKKVKITVQTEGEKFEEKISHLKAGSYKCVAFILPLSFMVLWILALFYFLGMAR